MIADWDYMKRDTTHPCTCDSCSKERALGMVATPDKDKIINGLAERVAAQSELLSKRAEKPTRKQMPVGTGVLDFFPDALLAIAHCSYVGNEQHNPGTELHWDRSKSTDEADALIRHFLERGTMDTDGVGHSVKLAWRALAFLQKEIEASK